MQWANSGLKIIELYRRNAGALSATPGVYLVPKLKREHVFLKASPKCEWMSQRK